MYILRCLQIIQLEMIKAGSNKPLSSSVSKKERDTVAVLYLHSCGRRIHVNTLWSQPRHLVLKENRRVPKMDP